MDGWTIPADLVTLTAVNRHASFLEDWHQVEPCSRLTWLDEHNRRNLFLAPHGSAQQYYLTMHMETDAGDIRVVEGVAQCEQGLIIIVRLHEEADEWVVLNGKTKDAPRSHSMFIRSPQLPKRSQATGASSSQAPCIGHVIIRLFRTEVTCRPADETRLQRLPDFTCAVADTFSCPPALMSQRAREEIRLRISSMADSGVAVLTLADFVCHGPDFTCSDLLLPTLADFTCPLPDFICRDLPDTFSCPPALRGQGAREEIRLRIHSSSGQCDSPFRNTTAMKWRTCENCVKRTWKMQKCGSCKLAHYCSKACQLLHWRSGHKYHCCPDQPLPKGRMYISIHHQPEILELFVNNDNQLITRHDERCDAEGQLTRSRGVRGAGSTQKRLFVQTTY